MQVYSAIQHSCAVNLERICSQDGKEEADNHSEECQVTLASSARKHSQHNLPHITDHEVVSDVRLEPGLKECPVDQEKMAEERTASGNGGYKSSLIAEQADREDAVPECDGEVLNLAQPETRLVGMRAVVDVRRRDRKLHSDAVLWRAGERGPGEADTGGIDKDVNSSACDTGDDGGYHTTDTGETEDAEIDQTWSMSAASDMVLAAIDAAVVSALNSDG